MLLLVAGLLAWALQSVPIADIGIALRNLQLWQILVILGVNLTLFLLITFRWWVIVHADFPNVRFLPLVGVRVSAFSMSYFTLGPQVGGEPLQVLALQKKYAVSYSRATASVLLEKLLEFLVNFVVLAFGMAALFHSGMLRGAHPGVQFAALFLVLLIPAPAGYLFLLFRRIYPLTWLLRRLSFISHRSKPVRFVRAAEWLAGHFCRYHPRRLLGALGASLLAAVGMLVDYFLMLHFLGIDLVFWKMAAGWTAGWVAFLFPLPGGLGALESSQVFALGLLGIPAALALSIALLMRARDLFIGGIGLILVSVGVSAWKKKTYYHPENPFADPSRKGELS